MAAAVPAGPPPTTRTSVSASTGTLRSGSTIVFEERGRLVRTPPWKSSTPTAAPMLLEKLPLPGGSRKISLSRTARPEEGASSLPLIAWASQPLRSRKPSRTQALDQDMLYQEGSLVVLISSGDPGNWRSFVKTAITEMFGIRHPIIQGGMHFVGFAELAAAVSNAGGLGIITGLTQRTPDLLAREIARCREMTDKPFGVNLSFLPSVNPRPYPEYIAAIIEGGVKIVETAGRNPEQHLPPLKKAGIKIIHKCTSVRHSLKAERIGCDAVSVDGFECGGHPGEDDVPNMILLPRAADELKIPFVASGGMADGRSLVAALALGAAGMNMGTRFIATKEAPVHDNVKQAIVAASELDTRLIMRALRNTERVLKNKGVERLLDIERTKGAAVQFADIKEHVSDVYPRVLLGGEMDAGAWSCGMVAGLINDIPTVSELIERIMSEAECLIRDRLSGLLGGGATAAAKVA